MPRSVNVGQAYSVIFQLRPKDNEVLKFIKNKLKDRNLPIIKEIEKKYGVDLYLNDQKFSRALAKKLKKSFKGEVKFSKKLYSVNRQTSKKMYRVTICFRLKQEVL